MLETCRNLEQTYTKRELCVKLVIYKKYTEIRRIIILFEFAEEWHTEIRRVTDTTTYFSYRNIIIIIIIIKKYNEK